MIVMKFGGASLASPSSINRVASIVKSQLQRQPVVVVSAIGDTTDQLVSILDHAAHGELYLAWKAQEELKAYHFCLAEDLISGKRLDPIDRYIRETFRNLHVRITEVCEGERALTPELRDWVTSLGEQLSGRIVTAALQESGLSAMHLDATHLILTDARFTNAVPRYWESYARIRWSVPIAARDHVVVTSGFIGATENGRITTLGRGGSDLTASIIGAAINAEEIQVWKDVDGMLTWDPKLKRGGYRVKSLSYDEASELARAGATILHPETMEPARRLRIPVVIRNTFRPDGEGTTIGVPDGVCSNVVKSVACKTNTTVMEIRSPARDATLREHLGCIETVSRECKAATLLAMSDEAIYLALDGSHEPVAPNEFLPDRCLEAHIRAGQAIVTLVGEGVKNSNAVARLSVLLARREAVILPRTNNSCSIRIVLPQQDLFACMDIVQRTFFTDLDPVFFAAAEPAHEEPQVQSNLDTPAAQPQRAFSVSGNRVAFPGVRL